MKKITLSFALMICSLGFSQELPSKTTNGKQLFAGVKGTNKLFNTLQAPSIAAPTPPNRNAGDVISLFSNAYTNKNIDNWNAGPTWDGYGRSTTDIQIAGNDTKKVDFPGFIGVDFSTLVNRVDLTSMERFHMDIWTESVTLDKSFNLKLSNWNGGMTESSAIEFSYVNASDPALPNENPGTWISIDMPLSAWGIAGGASLARNDIAQFIITSDLVTVYFDNVYIYKGTALSTTNFEKSNLKVYPNPATSNLTIEANNAIEKVSIHNVLGQEVFSKSPKTNNTTLDISNLQKGTYILRTTSEGKTETTKVLKK